MSSGSLGVATGVSDAVMSVKGPEVLASVCASLVWLFTYDCLIYALPFWFAMGLALAIAREIHAESGHFKDAL